MAGIGLCVYETHPGGKAESKQYYLFHLLRLNEHTDPGGLHRFKMRASAAAKSGGLGVKSGFVPVDVNLRGGALKNIAGGILKSIAGWSLR